MKHRDLVDQDDALTGFAADPPPRAAHPHEPTAPNDPFLYYTRLARLKAFVLANVDRSISAAEAASAVNLQHRYFSTWFKKKTGVRWRDWITEQHLQEAERLFRARNYQVLEAALAAGFGSISAFERACGRYRGMTPRELRASLHSSAGQASGTHNSPPTERTADSFEKSAANP